MRSKPADHSSFWLPGVSWDAAVATATEPADADARQSALDPSRSFIVQAPAGSGKTELLIQRYLSLLARVAEPESVVAITFTIKAAGEMRARVLSALHKAKGGVEPEGSHERKTHEIARAALERDTDGGWNLLENPARMRIQTIDALCMSITRQMPWLARFGSMPQVTDDARAMYLQAAERTIRLLASEGPIADAVALLLRHLDNDASIVANLLARMLETRDHWLRVIGSGPEPESARERLEATLAAIVGEAIVEVRGLAPAEIERELTELTHYSSGGVGCDLGNIDDWLRMRSLALTKDGTIRKQVTRKQGFSSTNIVMKRRMEGLLAKLASVPEFCERLHQLGDLPPVRYSDSQWNVLNALFRLLPVAVAELKGVFAQTGVVDFTEISQAALRALGPAEHPTDLGMVMGSRIEHLLVDEFQDTSVAQYELLRSLTVGWEPADGRTLFLVGDPMQSIYRFRQAEVGLFLKIRSFGLPTVHPDALRLTVNFRSSSAIVDWVNSAFATAFPEEENAFSGAVPYTSSSAWRESDEGSEVVVHPFFARQDAAEAELIQRLIGPEKTAILVRARTHLFAIAENFRRRGVPFRAIEIESLGEKPVVQDLLALTRALVHLADRPAWLAILRAPWCALTLDDLEAIAGVDHQRPVWELLNREDLALSGDGAVRLRRTIPLLATSIASRGRVPARALIESAWISLGGPECVADEADLDDARAYFELLGQMEAGGDVEDLEALAGKVKDLFANPDPRSDGALELMTIHKAKGLEFDTVIVPGLGRIPRPEDQLMLLWSERPSTEGTELVMAPLSARREDTDPICRYLRREERRKNEYEAVRLLYVAATRARRKLHLIGHVDLKVDGTMADPAAGSLLARIWETVRDEFTRRFQPTPPDESTATKEKRPASPIRRTPAEWQPAPMPSGIVVPNPRVAENPAGEEFGWVGDTWRHIGTVTHAVLERIAREGVGEWSDSRMKGEAPMLRAALATKGVPAGELTLAVERVTGAVSATLADPRGRWILTGHREARSEFELSGIAGGVLRHLVIDRTFIDEAGVRWVIDFKTSWHEGEGVEEFIAAERERYARQLTMYADLLATLEGGPVRSGLYFPLLGRWLEL